MTFMGSDHSSDEVAASHLDGGDLDDGLANGCVTARRGCKSKNLSRQNVYHVLDDSYITNIRSYHSSDRPGAAIGTMRKNGPR
jgi:hypothetical protein